MRLGTLDDLREALGGKTPEGKFVIGKTYACALKKAAGMGGTKYFDVQSVVKWRRGNPAWKMTDVYPNASRQSPKSSARRR